MNRSQCRKAKRNFASACKAYFADPALINWVWRNWDDFIPRNIIYLTAKQLGAQVVTDPNSDWTIDFVKNFKEALENDPRMKSHYMFRLGIDMEQHRVWISRYNLLLQPGVYLAKSLEDAFCLDWKKTIKDFHFPKN